MLFEDWNEKKKKKNESSNKWNLNNEIKLRHVRNFQSASRKIQILSRWITFASCILALRCDYKYRATTFFSFFLFHQRSSSPVAWLKEEKGEQRPRFYKYRSFDRIHDRWSHLRVQIDRLCKYYRTGNDNWHTPNLVKFY